MEECQRCHELDEERRTLKMACYYEMDELGLPFKHDTIQNTISGNLNKFYSLRVCKSCRRDWMLAIKHWFNNPTSPEEDCDSGIFVLECGAVKQIRESEWYAEHPDIEPVRFKHSRHDADKLVNDIVNDKDNQTNK